MICPKTKVKANPRDVPTVCLLLKKKNAKGIPKSNHQLSLYHAHDVTTIAIKNSAIIDLIGLLNFIFKMGSFAKVQFSNVPH